MLCRAVRCCAVPRQAQRLVESVLEARTLQLGTDHHVTATVMANLASEWAGLGRVGGWGAPARSEHAIACAFMGGACKCSLKSLPAMCRVPAVCAGDICNGLTCSARACQSH